MQHRGLRLRQFFCREGNMRLSPSVISIRFRLLALAAVLILPAPASHADTFTLSSNLTGALESPPSGSAGTGQATVVLNTTLNTLEVIVAFSGLGSPTTAS